ncbi:hypothetical protein D3C75_1207610 [compost metagenome]
MFPELIYMKPVSLEISNGSFFGLNAVRDGYMVNGGNTTEFKIGNAFTFNIDNIRGVVKHESK